MLIRTVVFFLPGMVLTGVILWRGALPVMTFANISIPPDLARCARALLVSGAVVFPGPARQWVDARSTISPAARESYHGPCRIVGVCASRNSRRRFARQNAACALVRSSSSPMWARRIVAP